MPRLFAALALPDEVAESLAPLRAGFDPGRWSPRENLHVTLRFFGEVSEVVADDLDLELSAITVAAPQVAVAGVGAFAEGADLRSIWAGVEPDAGLTALAKACERAARRAGLKPETRVFHPHVTLAYPRHADPAAVARWIQSGNLHRAPPFRPSGFALYSSHATRHGSRYELERFYRL